MDKVYALTPQETANALAVYLSTEKGIDLSNAISIRVTMLTNSTVVEWEELEENKEEKK